MNTEILVGLLAPIIDACVGRPVDKTLEALLAARFPADCEAIAAIERCLVEGIGANTFCDREAGGIRFSRPSKPGPATHGFSVDVVTYADLAGPRHAHPTGEIDLILPIDSEARFDGRGRGWLVYPPGSAHAPTITGGRAIVLYLLPEGKIDFSK